MKKIAILNLVFCFSSLVYAQMGSPKRNVLYTLGKNEILKYDEYYTYQTADKNGFSCIVRDTLEEKDIFIFNDKVIYTKSWIGKGILDLDLTKQDGYIFSFWENDNLYVNFRGKVEGPFEEVSKEFYFSNFKKPEKFNFFYQLGGKWYAYYEGKATVLEENSDQKNDEYSYCNGHVMSGENGKWFFSDLCGKSYRNKVGFDSLISKAISGDNVAYICKTDGKRYFCMNDFMSEPFDNSGRNFIELAGDKYIYSMVKNGKPYVNANGRQIEVVGDEGAYPSIFKTGLFYFEYSNKGKQYLNLNGKIYGPYDWIRSQVLSNGKFILEYPQEDKSYINVNGKVFGPYDGFSNYQILDNGKFYFVYSQGDLYYFNNNGVVSKGYKLINDITYKPDGTYKFTFSGIDGWVYENINGQIQKTQDRKFGFGKGYFEPSFEKYEIRSKANMNTMFLDIAYDYVVIDGRSYGKAPAIKAWYDEAKNSFVWNAWEGKELVLYEFPLQ